MPGCRIRYRAAACNSRAAKTVDAVGGGEQPAIRKGGSPTQFVAAGRVNIKANEPRGAGSGRAGSTHNSVFDAIRSLRSDGDAGNGLSATSNGYNGEYPDYPSPNHIPTVSSNLPASVINSAGATRLAQ